MKDLEVNENTTLHPPDIDGEVEIEIFNDCDGWNSQYVLFDKLEKWVASIREQIITSSNEQAKCFDGNCPDNIRFECVNPKSKQCYKPPVG